MNRLRSVLGRHSCTVAAIYLTLVGCVEAATTVTQVRNFDLQTTAGSLDSSTLSFDRLNPSVGSVVGPVFATLNSWYTYTAYLYAEPVGYGAFSASAEHRLDQKVLDANANVFFSQTPVGGTLVCLGAAGADDCSDGYLTFPTRFDSLAIVAASDIVGTGTYDMIAELLIPPLAATTDNATIISATADGTWYGTIKLQYSYIPIPAALPLAGSSLLCLGVWMRRPRKAAA